MKKLVSNILNSCLWTSSILFLALNAWAVPNLDGNWLKSCEDQDGDYVSSSLKVNKAQWNFSHVGFEDEECRVKYLQFDRSYTAVVTDSKLDLKLVDAVYTPMSDEVAEALNEAEFCGVTSWKKNKKVSIVGKDCSDVDNYLKNQMTYSIYKMEVLDGKNHLQVGEASAVNTGATPATRHASLEQTAYQKSR